VTPWLQGGPVGVSTFADSRWYWGGNPGTLVAFDVSDSTAPKFVSDITVGGRKHLAGNRPSVRRGRTGLSEP